MEKTPIQKLDAILKYLRDYKDHALGGMITDLRLRFDTHYKIDELRIALKKLEKDGYIHTYPQSDIFTISLEGDLFIGYENKDILDRETIQSLSVAKAEAKIYAHRLLCATWCAGIAAVLLLLWQVFLFYYPHYSDYPFHFLFEKKWIYGIKKP